MTSSAPEPTQARPADRDVLEQEIENTREELGSTVAALSRKLDVKTRVKTGAQHKVSDVKTGAQNKVSAVKSGTMNTVSAGKERVRTQPWVPAAAAAVLLVAAALVVWKRRA